MRDHLHNYTSKLSVAERAAFAHRAGTTPWYLRRLVYDESKAIDPDLALRLEIASGNQLDAAMLCPDFDWAAAARNRCPCSRENSTEG